MSQYFSAVVTRTIDQNEYKDACISDNRDDVYDKVDAHEDLICPNLLYLLLRLVLGNFTHDVSQSEQAIEKDQRLKKNEKELSHAESKVIYGYAGDRPCENYHVVTVIKDARVRLNFTLPSSIKAFLFAVLRLDIHIEPEYCCKELICVNPFVHQEEKHLNRGSRVLYEGLLLDMCLIPDDQECIVCH